MLIIFAGLSGVGKTTIARELARQIGAVYLRIDSIEQALRDSEAVVQPVSDQSVNDQPVNDAGYCVGYALAEDNLRLGHTVIADSVNPLSVTRAAWADIAKRAGVDAIEIEVQCSDPNEHRRRVEARVSDIRGLRAPTWQEVVSREYHAWDHEHVVVDTAGTTFETCVSMIRELLPKR